MDIVKSPIASKTLWVNILGTIGYFVSRQFGIEIPPDVFTIALAGINVVLRWATKKPIAW